MQTKLVTAYLATLAHQAMAVNTKDSDQNYAGPYQALLDYYTNCKVQVQDLVGQKQTLGDELKLTPSFNIVGIDENCPDLIATLWIEPPASCAGHACGSKTLEKIIEPEDMVNGSFSFEFETSASNGEWHAHILISPYGWECAMAVAEACTQIDVLVPCAASVTSFTGHSAINYEMGEPSTYFGVDGLSHYMNWAVTDLWNCNLCANFHVQDIWGEATATGTMDRDTLIAFSKQPQISTELMSHSSWNDFEFTLSLVTCKDDPTSDSDSQVHVQGPLQSDGPTTDTHFNLQESTYCDETTGNCSEEPYYEETILVPNPHPPCTVIGHVKIDAVTIHDGLQTIDQSIDQEFSYTCAAYELTSTLYNDDAYSAPLETTNGIQEHTSRPSNSEFISWESYPVLITSVVEVTANDTSIGSFTDETSYWPECQFEVETPKISALINNGTNIKDHKLTIDTVNSIASQKRCPSFDAELQLLHNGDKFQSAQFTIDEETTQVPKSFDLLFNDGEYCAQLTLTPTDAQPGETPVTKTSALACVTISAYQCEITPDTIYEGVLNKTTEIMTHSLASSYTMNNWCDKSDMTYAWTYKYMDRSWKDVGESEFDYVTPLRADQYAGIVQDAPESDFQIETKFVIDYNPTSFDTQKSFQVNDTASFQHVESCRPRFAYNPIINDFKVIENHKVILDFLLEFDTANIEICGEMFALVEVFDQTTDQLVYNFTMDNATVFQYNRNEMPPIEITNLEEMDICYLVKVTYGQVGKTSSIQAQSSGITCHEPICELKDASITMDSFEVAEDGQSNSWNFNTAVNANKWCNDVDQVVCVSTLAGTKYCTEPSNSLETNLKSDQAVLKSTPTKVTVIQTGSLSTEKFTFDVLYTSDDETEARDSGAHTVPKRTPNDPHAPCNFNTSSSLEVQSDTLYNVIMKQNIDVQATSDCGASEIIFVSDVAEQTIKLPLMSHTWNLPSETKQYCFSTIITFANYANFSKKTDYICTDWIQACEVQVSDAHFVNFVAANSAINSTAQANINIAGVALGDCDDVDVSVTMNGTDSTQYTFNVTDDFFSLEGQNINQQVSHFEECYDLMVSMNAPNAQSPASHQNMTTGDGFNNILSSSDEADGCNKPTVCNVVANSIEWISYEEVTDWSGPMLAKYSGVVTLDQGCTNTSAELQIRMEDTSEYYNKTAVTLIPTGDGSTYTWDQSIHGKNIYHSPVGKITVKDNKNGADNDHAETDPILWQPPCYLVINNFEKTDQIESLDQLRTVLDYNIQLAQHGDQACTDSSVMIALEQSNTDSFLTHLDETDLQVALSEGGFNVSIQTEAIKADSAKIYFNDVQAKKNVTDHSAGFGQPDDYSCKVKISDFCLQNAEDMTSGRWAFQFSIRIEQNAQCDSLTATMDLVDERENFFANVALDGDQIIDAFNCDCEKIITVYADYDGTPGEIYGQIDIRSGQLDSVLLADSCIKEVPMENGNEHLQLASGPVSDFQYEHYQLAVLDLDAKMTSMSDWPGHEINKGWGKLNSLKTAASHPADRQAPEWWLAIEWEQPQKASAIVIQGRGDAWFHEIVSSFYIQYMDENGNWIPLTQPNLPFHTGELPNFNSAAENRNQRLEFPLDFMPFCYGIKMVIKREDCVEFRMRWDVKVHQTNTLQDPQPNDYRLAGLDNGAIMSQQSALPGHESSWGALNSLRGAHNSQADEIAPQWWIKQEWKEPQRAVSILYQGRYNGVYEDIIQRFYVEYKDEYGNWIALYSPNTPIETGVRPNFNRSQEKRNDIIEMPLLEELVCYGIKLTIKKEDKTKNYQLRWDTKVQSIA